MKKLRQHGSKVLSILAAAIIAAGASAPAFIAPAIVADAGQQLGQTNFDDGIGLPWHIVESEPAKMEFSIEKGVYKIKINNPGGASNGGEDRWDCQFRHRGLKIVAGHEYEVKYEITASKSGKYYTKIGNLDGDVEIWHNMSTNAGDFGSNWDPIPIEAKKTKKVELTFTADQSLDVAEWAFHLGGDGQYTPGGCFPEGTEITFDNMSLIDKTGNENDYAAEKKAKRSSIMMNQAGFLKGRTKRATLLCSEKSGIKYDILNESGKKVFSGKSIPFGKDKDSGDQVHILDFTKLDKEGKYTIKTADGKKSRQFAIGNSEIYSQLLYDSLNYFYQNRSGIEIKSQYITSGDKEALARAAGHPTDNAEIMSDWDNNGSGTSIDVTGGWYDAGDHGKYVVNGGFSLWLMQNQYETAKKYGYEKVYKDGTLYLPESANKAPDILDEARWEMDWMLKMIVADGEYKGMAYHKAHDEKWTGLGIAPADDEMKRIVKPPSTAATLNLAACGAQASRLWTDYDADFAKKCLDAAVTAYDAAKKNPKLYAPLDQSVGGGAYGDDDVEDEFYWAACELYLTTGDKKYLEDMKDSKYYLAVPTTLGGGESVNSVGSFDWGHTAALGTFSLAVCGNGISQKGADTIKDSICKAADHFIGLEKKQGYGLPYAQSTISYNDKDKGYLWGSNSFVADNSIVIAYAYMLSKDEKYMNGALAGVDYLLGRNAMDNSYVTGYGANAIKNPHHRYWAGQIDSGFPLAPSGVMSGGPNSGMQDPWVKGMGWKKGTIAPQKCYMDHIEAWSVNECTINWNASLAWLIGFTAQENGGIKTQDTSALGAEPEETTAEPEEEATEPEEITEAETENEPTEENIDEEIDNGEEIDDDDIDEEGVLYEDDEEDSSKNKKDKDDDKSSNIPAIALISGACVIALISIELFVYKMIKLKKKK